MALIDNAVDGLIGSLVTGGIGLLAMWLSRRSRGPKEEKAWQDRAEELTKLITAQFSNEISYLRKQLDGCQEECRRLNRIINRQIRGGGQ